MVNEKVHWAWLHLSDIHFGHGSKPYQEEQEAVITEILSAVEVLVEIGAPKPAAILLTGDIAFSGGMARGPQEYADAVDLVSKLRNLLDNHLPVFAVPGNHDVQRTPDIKANNEKDLPNNTTRLLRALRDAKSGENLDDVIRNTADTDLIAPRFQNYNEFCQKIGSPVDENADGLWLERVDIGGNLKVHLAGMNTALLCNDDTDKEKLSLAKAASNAAFLNIPKGDLVFALTHHPVDWLNAANGPYLARMMRKYAHVHLHGHMHDPETQRITYGAGGSLVTVAAGAVHPDEAENRAGTPATFSVGAIVELDDGSIAIRIWPRRWAGKQVRWAADSEQLPEGSPFVEHVIRSPVRAAPVPLPGDPLRRFARSAVAELGRRRTAFPTDMSVEELRAAGLVVTTRFGRRGAKDQSELMSAGSVIADYSEKNILILGAPGAGKTVILYEISKGLLEQTERVPIVVDIAKFKDSKIQLSDLVQIGEVNLSSLEEKVRSSGAFIVDGIDEALSAGVAATTISSHLKALAKMGQLIVSCRENDYDYTLSGYVPFDIFDHIWYVHDWDPMQFEQFVAQLNEGHVFVDQSLTSRVQADPNLAALVRRPLLARMLTFLADNGELPSDRTSLYSEYMNRLGSATDVRVRAVGCNDIPSAVDLWQDLSWHICRSQLEPDSLYPADLAQFALDQHASAQCVRRALAGILDIQDGPSAYFHYSFYEFLTARYISSALQRNMGSDPESCISLLRRDLTPEIRHHLVDLLTRSGIDLTEWPHHLAKMYKDPATEHLQDGLTVKNLLAYLASRLEVPAHESLVELLRDETNLFLRNSLSWALAQQNNWTYTSKYFDELQSDHNLASYNRGYTLYYFGDLPESKGPPYSDDRPDRAWLRTRGALNQRYNAATYPSLAPARKAVDMYTFCDIACVRNESLTAEEVERFRRLVSSLAAVKAPPNVVAQLTKKLDETVAARY
ncbi:metallophosphoesterase [Mycobacterium paraense]|uniref:metallophosphoesterase n=1 Tax=Mycobacterium paraense TaxID=767916 RepID=UPI001152C375|nr:metallophosphoesterase [Mycobacterium paraense]MCV7442604.1 metallophosphoesterase [Mycobacterium paraense]